MFSKFTSILQHAVDALAPQLSLQEEFVYHWKSVTNFFIDNKGEKLPIEQTSIPAHLEQMLVILQEEDSKCDKGLYGPCLEYLLQHKLLETLNSLGRTDYPPGMKQIVLSFFTKLLSRIKQPLLAHVNVYRAVQRLIKTCGEVKAGPSEIEEIQFLCTVCAKIKSDPYLVNFFLEMPKSTTSPNTPVVDEPTSENKLQQEFHLVNTLLTLSHSEDSRVAVKACEGLILCSSLPDLVAAHCLVNSTQFCDDFTQRLIDTYQKLPKEINPLDLENVQAKWGMDVVTKREDETTFVGKRYLISFLSWLDYCDQLSTIANPIVAEALARTIHQKFLIQYFQPDLLQISEKGCIASMGYMTRCLRTVCSQRLLSELVLFLLGDDRKPESHDTDTKCDTLRCRLVDRCNSVSEEVCLITLQLFDTLLQKDDEHIYHNLVLRNLETRCYFDIKHKIKPSESTPVTESDVLTTTDDNTTTSENESSPQTENSEHTSSTEATETVSTLSPLSTPLHVKTEVHKVVNSFLTLLPEDLKSSYQTVDGGYDMYLKDAHKQYLATLEACKSWGYPQDVTSSIDNSDTTTFYEGSFLHMILEKFSHLLDQSYSINLQLTSVISKLALNPHPCLHEFLLDPFLPLKPGIRNLFSIFLKVSNEIKSQNASEPELFRKLVTIRKKLMGNATSMQSIRKDYLTWMFDRLDDESRLEAIIVFEEFCKELSAIVFVKHHAAVTEDKK